MSDDHIHGAGTITAAGSGQEGETAVASSAVAAPFAEVRQEAEKGALRPLFGAAAPAGARGATAAPTARQEGGSAAASSALPVAFAESEQEAKQAAVRPLLGAASLQPALTGAGFTYRHNWGARRGQWTLRLNMAGVTALSRVFVSIGEGSAPGPDAGKFIGAARYTVHNVAPRAGGVDIWVNIEWSSDILLYVDYLVVNP
jgi:hypothetical protein